jgi:squalene synthase HpnC
MTVLPMPTTATHVDAADLRVAYAECERLARTHYENFPVASRLVPARMRPHVAALYAFARTADDFADEGQRPDAERLRLLDDWQNRLHACVTECAADDRVFLALGATIRACHLPVSLFDDLLSAFRQDITTHRYDTWASLLDYCRRSANPVGRLLLHLFKRTNESNCRASDAICSALQLINFWQDVDVDYAKDGRIYLPQDEMAGHGVKEQHLSRRICDDAWRTLMAFQIERTRKLMLDGAPLGHALPGRIGLEIRATIQGGLRILEKIERADYDVFRRRPTLHAFDWPLLLVRAL